MVIHVDVYVQVSHESIMCKHGKQHTLNKEIVTGIYFIGNCERKFHKDGEGHYKVILGDFSDPYENEDFLDIYQENSIYNAIIGH